MEQSAKTEILGRFNTLINKLLKLLIRLFGILNNFKRYMRASGSRHCLPRKLVSHGGYRNGKTETTRFKRKDIDLRNHH
jgi:hypothetical protein